MLEESQSMDGHDNGNGIGAQLSSNKNKVINVSFNDFNQSISNEYEDANPIRDFSRKNSDEAGFGVLVKQTQQSSNKNLNNFLEALQKIKP
jgi:hypothetical protein